MLHGVVRVILEYVRRVSLQTGKTESTLLWSIILPEARWGSPALARVRLNLTEFWPMSAKFEPISTTWGRLRPNFGPILTKQLGLNSNNIGPSWPTPASSGQIWGRVRPSLSDVGQLWPMSAKLELIWRFRSNFDRSSSDFGQSCPVSALFV